eukprot:maker-scaffold_4-snap-gene-15.1-mRNA-1 protein AED:0.04 eAED:0.05 QI:0/0/0/0.5/1/1/2/0/941
MQNLDTADDAGEPQSVFGAMMKEFSSINDKAKEEDFDPSVLPFTTMEKAAVLQEAKHVFNSPSEVKSANKCALILTRLIYLLVQGETFYSTDMTDVFFAVTKLFQSENWSLRRMTYLFLKEFAENTDSSDIIIVISSLTKDINYTSNNGTKFHLFCASAIRVLGKILDAQLLSQIDRYLKQNVTNSSPYISTATLVSAQHLLNKETKPILSRWLPEVASLVPNENPSVEFSALSLMFKLKQGDDLSVTRLIASLTTSNKRLSSPFALCLLIRTISATLRKNTESLDLEDCYSFLKQCLRNKSEMVILDAARAICSLPSATTDDVSPAVATLGLFLTSNRSVVRLAALRTINQVSSLTNKTVLASIKSELKLLVNDNNRSIATLAITTLLQLVQGDESSDDNDTVESLLKQIQSFVSEISDEFKLVIVKSVEKLSGQSSTVRLLTLMNFLSSLLREEGGYEFKSVVVDTLLKIVHTSSQASVQKVGLLHLCEFIEDCEFTRLSTRVMYNLGVLGPPLSDVKFGAKVVRYIYNRLILENSQVRAAAVSALGKFLAVEDEGLRNATKQLLNKCEHDEDDEVRDRAAFASKVNFQKLGPDVNIKMLKKQLEIFSKLNTGDQVVSFSVLPKLDEEDFIEEDEQEETKLEEQGFVGQEAAEPNLAPEIDDNLTSLISEYGLGQILKTSKVEKLTESEQEYLVGVRKLIFPAHILFHFSITNTVQDQVLQNSLLSLEETEGEEAVGDWEILAQVPADDIGYGKTKSSYVLLQLPKATEEVWVEPSKARFMTELRFTIEGDDIEEEYAVEDIEMKFSDFVIFNDTWNMFGDQTKDFRNTWSSLKIDPKDEVQKKLQLQYTSLMEAAKLVKTDLGLNPVEQTAPSNMQKSDEAEGKWNMFLVGEYVGSKVPIKIMARTQFVKDQDSGKVTLKIAAKAEVPEVAQLLSECL